MKSMIEVTNLTKKYGDHVAVDNLSFRVEKGQIYGFLGPNGAGKSTTMNIITGYIAASEGTVTIAGKDIQKEPEEAKKLIGYLPEMPPLYMEMTVEEYLLFAAQLKKVSKAEQKIQIEKVMEMTQITDMRSRLIKNLSKGYKQRVGLAQAIIGAPEVIILDEPSVGLDPKQIIEIRDLIRKLGENHTIILSSHILSEVSAVCDHIMIIAHGHLVASDSPAGLQKLMAGTMELQLTVKGNEEKVRTVLESVEGVEAVEVAGKATGTGRDAGMESAEIADGSSAAAGSGEVKVKVVLAENADVREEIFYALANAKLPIMEMAHSEKSLEDIFLELTSEATPKETEKKGLFGRKKKAEKGSDVEEIAPEDAATGTDKEMTEAAERITEDKEEK